jgi:plasmid stabilization system protein ParE
MANRRYYLSRQARADLDGITEYLRVRSPESARRVLLELKSTFQVLADGPELGTRRDDLRTNVRIFSPSRPARHYIVFYYPHPNGIEISDVIHAAQDWPEMFSRDER